MPNITVYVMTTWQNLPAKTSALEATNLNHIEQGIKNATDFINNLHAESGMYLCEVAFTNALKTKLDGIEAQANNYSLPTASTSTKGGIKIDGTTITIDENGVIHAAASATQLSQLTDVNLTDLADGQILKWDAENNKWVNTSEAEVRTQLSQLTDVNIQNLQNGQSLRYNATTQKWENAEAGDVLSYSETLNVLGEPGELDKTIPLIYSLDERVVGEWVDKRPLYQRTFLIEYQTPTTLVANTEIILDSAFVDLSLYDNIFRGVITCYANNNVDAFMGDDFAGIQQTSYQNKGLILIVKTSLTSVTKIIATVNYTKSTDNA